MTHIQTLNELLATVKAHSLCFELNDWDNRFVLYYDKERICGIRAPYSERGKIAALQYILRVLNHERVIKSPELSSRDMAAAKRKGE